MTIVNNAGEAVAPQSVAAKYSAAIVAVAIAVAAAVASAGDGFANAASAWQIVLVGLSAVGIYFLPLVSSKYAGILKTGLAVAVAVVTAIVPLVAQDGKISGTQIIVVVLAGLQALGSALGVAVRRDAVSA